MESTPGKRLLEWREFKGLTLAEMARITGISKTTINTVEQSGSSNPSYDTITKVLSGFPDLNPDWLLLGKEPMLRDGRALTPSESPRINSDRELARVMTEEDMRISDTSGPPYRMRRITRTPEEEMEYLRAELLRERQAHERTRERHEADRNQSHERETLLIKQLGGKADASADAADADYTKPVMVAHTNREYAERAAEAERTRIGFVFGSLS